MDDLRTEVQRDRDICYGLACEYADEGKPAERLFGKVEAYDEVLLALAGAERTAQLAKDLGTHADLKDPVHHGDVFSRIAASAPGEGDRW